MREHPERGQHNLSQGQTNNLGPVVEVVVQLFLLAVEHRQHHAGGALPRVGAVDRLVQSKRRGESRGESRGKSKGRAWPGMAGAEQGRAWQGRPSRVRQGRALQGRAVQGRAEAG